MNVLALIMDGHTINKKMVNLFGCKIMPDTINSSIPHPSDSLQNVYIFFDAEKHKGGIACFTRDTSRDSKVDRYCPSPGTSGIIRLNNNNNVYLIKRPY